LHLPSVAGRNGRGIGTASNVVLSEYRSRSRKSEHIALKTLKCIRRNDIDGFDEPRIKVGGDPVWNGAVKKGNSVNIGIDVPFTNKVNVIAEEMNGTNAQQIGAAAEVRESGNPAFLTFKTSGTWYEVYFDAK